MPRWAKILLVFFLAVSPVYSQPIEETRICHQVAIPEKLPNIRLLIIKHSMESMADSDGNLASLAAKKAAEQGLPIQVINIQSARSISEFEKVVEDNIKLKATRGDTLIIHTIGHGFGNSQEGSLQNLGDRSGVMSVLTKAADKHNQRLLWWQLSCHAAAGLPPISSLNEEQKKLFSSLASSAANQLSPTRQQAEIMGKVFIGLATNKVDTNKDHLVSAGELRNFLNTVDNARRGDLFFANKDENIIFGIFIVPKLPIVDRNNKNPIDYDDDYIFAP